MPPNYLGDGRFMCRRCISDDHLKNFIRGNAISHQCSFCGRENRSRLIAADADEVAQHVVACVEQEYEDAAEMVPYESREGGYQASIMTNEEVLYEVGLEDSNSEAFEFLVDALPDKAWVQTDFFSLRPHQTLSFGWRDFAEAVKHKTRYLFFERENQHDQHDEIPPQHMLATLGEIIGTAGLIRKLPAGTVLYRARPHSRDEDPATVQELGPPPDSAASSNRLSPAGISMMYASEDEGTAIAEVRAASQGSSCLTVGKFRLDAAIRVVDFVRLPKTQSVFASDTTPESRAKINFASAFAREISKPVEYDGSEHIEYIPTQIVTEFLRHEFRPDGKRIRGIRYASARRPDGKNVVLFASYADLQPDPFSKPQIELTLLDHWKVA